MRKKDWRKLCSRAGALLLSTCLLASAVPEIAYAAPENEVVMSEMQLTLSEDQIAMLGEDVDVEEAVASGEGLKADVSESVLVEDVPESEYEDELQNSLMEEVADDGDDEGIKILKYEGYYTPYEGATYSLSYSTSRYYGDDEGIKILKYEGYSSEQKLVIPEEIEGVKVTRINDEAFKDSDFCGELVLPKGLTHIGEDAFSGCSGLTGDLIIPGGVTVISDGAFMDCGFDGELKICKGVSEIGGAAFFGCQFSGDLIIPEGVTVIDSSAFEMCRLNGELKLPKSLTTIGHGAFWMCGFSGDVIIPEGVTSIGRAAFYMCWFGNKDIRLPGSVEEIGEDAFYPVGDYYWDETQQEIIDSRKTIYAPKGSYAESYADEYGFRYVEWYPITKSESPMPDDVQQTSTIPQNESWILIMDENAMPIADAEISITKMAEYSFEEDEAFDQYTYENGVIKVPVEKYDVFTLNVSVNKEEMRPRSEYICVSGGTSNYIKLHPSTIESTLTGVILEETGTNLLKENACVNMADMDTITLIVTTSGTRPTIYGLTRNGMPAIGREIVPTATAYGDVLEIDLEECDLVNGEIGLTASYWEEEGGSTRLFHEKIHLQVIEEVEVTEITKTPEATGNTLKLWNDPFTFRVNQEVPVFGGSKFSMDSMIDLPVKIEKNGSKVRALKNSHFLSGSFYIQHV